MSRASAKKAGAIRVGVGGWTFEPWRGVFYPKGFPQKRELEYAASKLTSIEINGTYYGSQKPESFVRWREETPDGLPRGIAAQEPGSRRVTAGPSGRWISRLQPGPTTSSSSNSPAAPVRVTATT